MSVPQPPAAPGASTSSEPQSQPESQPSFFSQRSRRQLGLFAAGAGFFMLTTLVTRRSIVRRYKMLQPKYFHPSNRIPEVNGAFEAFEALNLATINVLSVSMMSAGGMAWALDVSTLEELRQRVRTQVGMNLQGSEEDKDSEKEIEEWFATMLSRKEFKALRGEMKDDSKENEDSQEDKAEDTQAQPEERSWLARMLLRVKAIREEIKGENKGDKEDKESKEEDTKQDQQKKS